MTLERAAAGAAGDRSAGLDRLDLDAHKLVSRSAMRTVETRRRFLRCHVARLIAEPRLCVRRHGRRTLRSLADGPPVITISIGRLADRSRENDVTMKIKLECLSSLPSERILEGCGPGVVSRQSKASVPAVGEYHAARARPVRYALFGKPVGMLAHNVVLGRPVGAPAPPVRIMRLPLRVGANSAGSAKRLSRPRQTAHTAAS